MKIVALAAEAWGGRGGIAQSTRDLLGVWVEQPGIAKIEVLPRLAAEATPALPAGIVQHPPSMGRLTYMRRALWLTATRQPDIVYCGHAFMAPLAQLAARAVGAKLVAHVHGLEVWQPLSPAARRGLAGADRVLCVSRHTVSKVVEIAGVDPSRCTAIFNTVDDRFVPGDRAAARARFDLPADATVLSTVARLDPRQRHKGHDRVIPLLADLARDVPGLTYLVAGTGSDLDRLEALARKTGAEGIVRFLGFVGDEALPDLYRASDLYVMPSHGEGFGIAFVEAMCCGTPALGLDAGGAGDGLRDGELGRAVPEAEFPAALRAAVLAPASDCADLAARTRAAFGRPAFAARLVQAIAPLSAGQALPQKAFSQ
ncbi:glycosyltransferase family 4 protein [Histidinibacterium lentulum]|uniref:Glycosyltransferase n=1 Tax=Histidinibacterium lentulum TaxID=2480588 RepID=A0A3N2QV91_9RHOB|nr:glycosyltransferase family 4 protein [Histidinibacterium lentulum]ROT99090.1 glycosyltransferase [Histidinibacterium lentulum]